MTHLARSAYFCDDAGRVVPESEATRRVEVEHDAAGNAIAWSYRPVTRFEPTEAPSVEFDSVGRVVARTFIEVSAAPVDRGADSSGTVAIESEFTPPETGPTWEPSP